MCVGLLSGDGGDVVLTTEEVTSEETAVDGRVRSAVQGKGKLVVEWGHTLHHIDDVPFEADMTDLKARRRSSIVGRRRAPKGRL